MKQANRSRLYLEDHLFSVWEQSHQFLNTVCDEGISNSDYGMLLMTDEGHKHSEDQNWVTKMKGHLSIILAVQSHSAQ